MIGHKEDFFVSQSWFSFDLATVTRCSINAVNWAMFGGGQCSYLAVYCKHMVRPKQMQPERHNVDLKKCFK